MKETLLTTEDQEDNAIISDVNQLTEKSSETQPTKSKDQINFYGFKLIKNSRILSQRTI